jgi:hypothetical protein
MKLIQSFVEKYSKMMNSVHSENYMLPVVVVRIFQTMSSTNVIRSHVQNARRTVPCYDNNIRRLRPAQKKAVLSAHLQSGLLAASRRLSGICKGSFGSIT